MFRSVRFMWRAWRVHRRYMRQLRQIDTALDLLFRVAKAADDQAFEQAYVDIGEQAIRFIGREIDRVNAETDSILKRMGAPR